MSTAERKKKLIGKITSTEYEALWLEVSHLLFIDNEDIPVYPLPVEEIPVLPDLPQPMKDGKLLNEWDMGKEIGKCLDK